MRFFLPITAGILALTATALAGPGGHHGPRGDGPGHAFREAVHSLDLSEDQRAELQALRGDREERGPDRDAMRTLRDAFHAELLSDDADRAELARLSDEMSKQREARRAEKIDRMFEITRILTPAQRAEVAAQLDARKDEHGGRHDGDARGQGPRKSR